MFWARKSPFTPNEDAAEHMVALLARHAELAGSPLNDEEKKLLREDALEHPLTEAQRQRFLDLIQQLLERELKGEGAADPRSFGNSVEWAGDPEYPNVVALAEDVIVARRQAETLRVRMSRELKDLAHLVGCALMTVFLFAVVVGLCALLFGRK